MQQQLGIVTHSRISFLLISRHLTRPRVASRYSVWTSSVTESGRGNPKVQRFKGSLQRPGGHTGYKVTTGIQNRLVKEHR